MTKYCNFILIQMHYTQLIKIHFDLTAVLKNDIATVYTSFALTRDQNPELQFSIDIPQL